MTGHVQIEDVAPILEPIQSGGTLPPEPRWSDYDHRPRRPDLFPLIVIGGAYGLAVALRLWQRWQESRAA